MKSVLIADMTNDSFMNTKKESDMWKLPFLQR